MRGASVCVREGCLPGSHRVVTTMISTRLVLYLVESFSVILVILGLFLFCRDTVVESLSQVCLPKVL